MHRAPAERPVYNRLLLTGSHTAAGRPPPGSHVAGSKTHNTRLLGGKKSNGLSET